MRIINPQAAKFDNTKIYVHRRSKKEGRRVDGRYIRIGGIFRLGTPNLPHIQYLGLHKNLFFTLNYPEHINDLLGIAADLPEVGGLGEPTTWLSQTSSTIQKGALWYFVPKGIWGFREGDYDRVISTSSYVSIVAGEGGCHYYLLHIPLISRDFLRARYRNFSLRENPKEKK